MPGRPIARDPEVQQADNRLTQVTNSGTTTYVYDNARGASRSEAEGQPADLGRRGGLDLGQQRQPARRWDTECSELYVVRTPPEHRMLDPCTWQGGCSWSLDGSHVAAWEGWRFTGWGTDTTDREARLRVFDLADSSVAECFLRFPEDMLLDCSQLPTWSPDSRFVAFSEFDLGAGSRRSWVLDLETGEAPSL